MTYQTKQQNKCLTGHTIERQSVLSPTVKRYLRNGDCVTCTMQNSYRKKKQKEGQT